ncbi:MAG: 30S ribosomal protein S8 [Xanthomonadales bacterium]|jgi:small subunit ribosomal protein S8|nr:30S ribosomal protein S8 [Xanthomonadales bacterium]
MSMSDPIADMLTRIRNAQAVFKSAVTVRHSSTKEGVARVLKDEGYISDFSTADSEGLKQLVIDLKYLDGQGVIDTIQRYSRPGLRQYRGKNDLPKVRGGLGIAIVSTSKGIMSDVQARKEGFGGEVLCLVS